MKLKNIYMNNLEGDKKNDYNDEPVFYCSQCLSLRVRDAGLPDLLYCDECGSADILTTDINSWENLYEDKYGFKYLNRNYK